MRVVKLGLCAPAWIVIAAALAAWALPARAADTIVYNISGRIDGSDDYLILHRNTVQWHHMGTVAAPGRQGGVNNDPTTITATLNGVTTMNAVAWLPEWSQPFPNQIRFEDFSSVFTALDPALPGADVLSADVSTASGRGTVTLEQFPTAANDYTLIAKFADGFNGSAFTEGRIAVVVPEPGITGVLVLGAAAALGLRRRR